MKNEKNNPVLNMPVIRVRTGSQARADPSNLDGLTIQTPCANAFGHGGRARRNFECFTEMHLCSASCALHDPDPTPPRPHYRDTWPP